MKNGGVILQEVKAGWCFTCGGNGFLDKPCTECGREPNNASFNLERKENVKELVKKMDSVCIPLLYQGVAWSQDELEHSHAEKLPGKFADQSAPNDRLFERFAQQLEKINAIFSTGMIPHRSAFICAPAGFSKITFAYSCMQKALDNGFSVAPLLDTEEAKRALILAGENPKYKINRTLDYDDWIMSDVMFITVTKMYTKSDAYVIVQELFDRRSRKGLSTFIISRFGVEEISKFDRDGSFDAIKRDSADSYKYPAIIQYTTPFHNKYKK